MQNMKKPLKKHNYCEIKFFSSIDMSVMRNEMNGPIAKMNRPL